MKTSVLVITISLLIAAFFRVVLPWNNTFVDNEVRFSQVDSYYSIEAVDMMRENTLNISNRSPYLLSEYIVFGLSCIISFGDPPSKNTTDTIAALFTALCGLLAILLIYFVTRELFNNEKIALLSIALAALMPGEFLSRTSLGFFDHHALEIVLFLASVLFFIRCIKNNKNYPIFNLIMSGLFASMYMFNWIGGILLPGIYILFTVAYIVFFIYRGKIFPIIISILPVIMICLTTFVLFHANLSEKATETIAIETQSTIASSLFSIESFAFLNNIIPMIMSRIVWDISTIISEGQPLLFSSGKFTLLLVWINFGILFPIFLFGLGIMLRQKITTARLFFLCWSIIILVLTLGGVRFAEYLAVNVAIISSFTIVYVYQRIKAPAKRLKRLILYTVFAGIIIVVPLVSYSSLIAKQSPEYFTDSWHDAMVWIDKNTDQDAIILSLWDYGYWIKREGNRKPFCDPGRPNNREITASLLLNSPEQSAIDMQVLDIGYIIIDSLMVKEKYYVYETQANFNNPIENSTVSCLYYATDTTGFEQVFISPEVVIYKIYEVK